MSLNHVRKPLKIHVETT